jgi:hypothetical protein
MGQCIHTGAYDMAGKKKAKKKAAKPAAAPAEKSGEGEEVVAEPAHVEERFIKVRGTGVGGTQMMTQSEYDTYCNKFSK